MSCNVDFGVIYSSLIEIRTKISYLDIRGVFIV